MEQKDQESVDPFSLFGKSNESPYDDWDPLADSTFHFDSDDADTSTQLSDPFAPITFTDSDVPVQHRRCTSSPLRIMSPQPYFSNPAFPQPPSQIPNAMSSCDFQSQMMRPFLIQRPVFRYSSEYQSPDEAAFRSICANPAFVFNPVRLGFIPPNLWEDRNMTFGECVPDFFQRKNNANSRFSHKLFNALCLSEYNPIYAPFVGVKWLNENILRVDKKAFARLLGIKSIDGSLFHQQGNFPSHGFFEIGAGDVSRYCPPGLDFTGVDFENVRLLTHAEKLFKRGCTEADIEHCRWANARK